MRSLAFVAIALGCAGAGQACAQSTLALSAGALNRAAFDAPDSPPAYVPSSFTAPSFTAQVDPVGQVIDREAYAPGAGPVRWNVGEVQLSGSPDGGPVDSLRVSVGGALVTPGGVPAHLDRAQFEPSAYEISVIRDWPSAVSFDGGKFDVDFSPHVGVGVGSTGGSAEGGATLKLTRKSRDERAQEALRGMGVNDGISLGDQGRWYLFMAVSGRAVGMNMLR
ncbi:MAG: hypothetical protein ABW360_16325, partial [Phenylobacterium sp.]